MTTTHKVTIRNVNGPTAVSSGGWAGPTSQHHARCTCGWEYVAVTAHLLALYVNGHHSKSAREA